MADVRRTADTVLPLVGLQGRMNFGAGLSADILWKCHALSSHGELIAAGAHGQPDFLALLHGRRVPVCVYTYDLTKLRGRDLRDQPHYLRRAPDPGAI